MLHHNLQQVRFSSPKEGETPKDEAPKGIAKRYSIKGIAQRYSIKDRVEVESK